MLYTLKLFNAVYQLYLHKNGKRKRVGSTKEKGLGV